MDLEAQSCTTCALGRNAPDGWAGPPGNGGTSGSTAQDPKPEDPKHGTLLKPLGPGGIRDVGLGAAISHFRSVVRVWD